jgi:hypothetical protein
MGAYLCSIILKTEVNMGLAVILFVSLSVEILSYLTGGNANENIKGKHSEKPSPETV